MPIRRKNKEQPLKKPKPKTKPKRISSTMPRNNQNHNYDDKWEQWMSSVMKEIVALNERQAKFGEDLKNNKQFFVESLKDTKDFLADKIDDMDRVITGSGNPEKGLLIRVDRLEQTNIKDLGVRIDRLETNEQKRSFLFKAVIVACIGAIITNLVQFLKH